LKRASLGSDWAGEADFHDVAPFGGAIFKRYGDFSTKIVDFP
jgi:hypothetical protein